MTLSDAIEGYVDRRREDNRPLVRITEAGRADDIRRGWMNLRKRLASLVKKEANRQADWQAQYEDLRRRSPELADKMMAELRLPPGTSAEQVAATATDLTSGHVAVRPLGFKYLRKTASNLIRRIADKDTAEVYLAHVDPTVGRKYHNPDFERLTRAINKLHSRIWPAAAVERDTDEAN